MNHAAMNYVITKWNPEHRSWILGQNVVPTKEIERPEHFYGRPFVSRTPKPGLFWLREGISTWSTWHPRICQVGHAQPSVSPLSRHVDTRSIRALVPIDGPAHRDKAEHSKRTQNLAHSLCHLKGPMQLWPIYQILALCRAPAGHKAGI